MSCLFCGNNFLEKAFIETENWFAIYDEYPVNKGHVLIIPKTHIQTFFDIPINGNMFKELQEIIFDVKKHLDKMFSPTGYNIGINNGKSSGQTINHLHIHLIPRYNNDGGFPCGVRNVLPNANYITLLK